MELKKIMNSSQGKIIISIILGLGLATMFKRVCKGRKCIVFEKASDEEIDNKIFKYDEKCYKFKLENTLCDKKKKTVKITK
jgi:hypothetical protein